MFKFFCSAILNLITLSLIFNSIKLNSSIVNILKINYLNEMVHHKHFLRNVEHTNLIPSNKISSSN